MSSTNMFQGLDPRAKPSSRVMHPPGGGSSDLFGGYKEDVALPRRPDKMASKIFSPPEQAQNVARRSNPPGGKSSGIFGASESSPHAQRTMPPGGPSNNIFGAAESSPVQSPSRNHPNKPKDKLCVVPEPELPAPQAKVSQPEVKEEVAPPAKVEPTPVPAPPEPESPPPTSSPPVERNRSPEPKNHEPHLGPRPRSHNRVLNPPGGKSSVIFY
ncbi:jupiter microtubule associated homolog 2 [Brachionichthys hirsutus]|uniref:jupiter microtubule associated homolog 2 n=1 Tax=Brachionichthys hirsutus TaxID=412623 RepID=UPI003604B44F